MHEQLKMAIRRELQEENLPFTEQEPLAEHTTFRIGGPATFWLTPSDVEQLRRSLSCCKRNGVRVYLLGNGSNTLFSDEGFDGAVVDLHGLSRTPEVREHVIVAGAGFTLGHLCAVAQQHSLTGLEFACGIPGTVGGAVYMNAGAYGGELKDVVTEVTYLDDELEVCTLPVSELQMGYRTSILKSIRIGVFCPQSSVCIRGMQMPFWGRCRSISSGAKKSNPWNGPVQEVRLNVHRERLPDG